MPATAGRVRMPANNRVHSSAALQTHGIWQSAIGYDPYAPDRKEAAAEPGAPASGTGGENAYDSFQGLLQLAKIQSNPAADEPRGACKKCGRVGHLSYQCRNLISVTLKEDPTPVSEMKPGKEARRKGDDSGDDSDSDDETESDSDLDSEMERALEEQEGRRFKRDSYKSSSKKSKKRSHRRDDDEDSSSESEEERERRHRKKKSAKKRSKSHSKRSKKRRDDDSSSDEEYSDSDSDSYDRRSRKKHRHKSRNSSKKSRKEGYYEPVEMASVKKRSKSKRDD